MSYWAQVQIAEKVILPQHSRHALLIRSLYWWLPWCRSRSYHAEIPRARADSSSKITQAHFQMMIAVCVHGDHHTRIVNRRSQPVCKRKQSMQLSRQRIAVIKLTRTFNDSSILLPATIKGVQRLI